MRYTSMTPRPSPLSRASLGGFSLIELLVVLLIVSLLIALALPALSAARQRATGTACLSNLRQLGTAVEVYLGNHDEVFPKARYMPLPFLTTLYTPGIDEVEYPALPIRLDAEVDRESKVWRCPGDEGDVYELTETAGEAATSYEYHHTLGERTIEQSWMVRRLGLQPSQVWVLRDFDGGADITLMDGSTVNIPFFHEERNFVFADGHAAADVEF